MVSVDVSCGTKEWLNEMSDLRRASVGVDGVVFFFSFSSFWFLKHVVFFIFSLFRFYYCYINSVFLFLLKKRKGFFRASCGYRISYTSVSEVCGKSMGFQFSAKNTMFDYVLKCGPANR